MFPLTWFSAFCEERANEKTTNPALAFQWLILKLSLSYNWDLRTLLERAAGLWSCHACKWFNCTILFKKKRCFKITSLGPRASTSLGSSMWISNAVMDGKAWLLPVVCFFVILPSLPEVNPVFCIWKKPNVCPIRLMLTQLEEILD